MLLNYIFPAGVPSWLTILWDLFAIVGVTSLIFSFGLAAFAYYFRSKEEEKYLKLRGTHKPSPVDHGISENWRRPQ